MVKREVWHNRLGTTSPGWIYLVRNYNYVSQFFIRGAIFKKSSQLGAVRRPHRTVLKTDAFMALAAGFRGHRPDAGKISKYEDTKSLQLFRLGYNQVRNHDVPSYKL